MRPARLVLPLVSALALAGCTADTPQPLAPRGISRNLQTASAGRFAVLATSSGFGKDFADRVAALGGTIEDVHSGAGFAVVSGLSSDAAAQLASASGVSEVQADAEVSLDAPLAVANADVSSVADASITSAANPAKAGYFAYQWNMRAIKADAAWAAGKLGSPKVTVAILDSGLDYDNPDLKANVDL
ncbi:MAG: hypothetical protein ACJ8AD_02180, partial [Gemmatimonadaceae bacterium]